MNHYPIRPGRVVAAAVLSMVYGGLMLVCSFCGAIDAVAGDANLRDLMDKELPSNQFVTISQAGSNLVIGVGMILLGIFVLQLKNFARIGIYVICTYELVMLLVHSVYAVIFVFPVTERFFADQAKNNAQVPFDLGIFAQGTMWLSLAFTFGFTLTFCGLIMFFLSGTKARAAFAEEFDAPDAPRSKSGRGRYDGYDDEDDYVPPPKSPGDTGITDRPS